MDHIRIFFRKKRKEKSSDKTLPNHFDWSRHRSDGRLPLLRRLEARHLLVCGSDADRDRNILTKDTTMKSKSIEWEISEQSFSQDLISKDHRWHISKKQTGHNEPEFFMSNVSRALRRREWRRPAAAGAAFPRPFPYGRQRSACRRRGCPSSSGGAGSEWPQRFCR